MPISIPELNSAEVLVGSSQEASWLYLWERMEVIAFREVKKEVFGYILSQS